LLDEIRLHGKDAELRDEVIELARKYGIVTPYTAYLISEDEAKRGVPLTMQSLPQLNTDRDAHQAAVNNWGSFKDQRDGVEALSGARFGSALKTADAPAAAVASGLFEADRALGVSQGIITAAPTLSDDSKARLVQYSQQTRFVSGKNFFRNSNQWVDTAVQQLQHAKRVRIQFSSPEYFALIRQEPAALPWLALDANVQFVLNGTIYEIYE
jgi:Ca-activated chloride channel family protein